MNIIKLQNMLRSVPDEALINYVQNPQGEVPSYLALSELQRRKDTRAKYQAEQAPESSVAEDLEQETMSDQGGLAMLAKNPDLSPGVPMSQGVADLPIDESMYQEDSFAAGGIVAFPTGGYVSTDPRPDYYADYEEEISSPFGRLVDYLDISGRVKKSDFGKRREERKKIDEKIQETIPTLIGGKRGWFDSESKAQRREYDQRRKELEAQKEKSPFFAPEPGGFVYDKKEAIDPNMNSYLEQEALRIKREGKDKAKTTDTKPTSVIKDTLKETSSVKQPAESEEDYLRRRMALYKEFMGPNEDRTKLQEKIDAMEKRAARQEELAPWMALTEAGFKTMAGTSPFALTNLGAGAEAGLKSYGAAQDKMAALEEKRYALMNEAAKADRAEKQAIVKFGFDSEEAKLNRDQKERLGLAELELRKEANRLTKEFNTARLGALTTGKTTKAMAELIQKTNAPIDKKLATLVMAGGKSKEVQDMIRALEAKKLANENKIRAMFGEDSTDSSAAVSSSDPLGIMK